MPRGEWRAQVISLLPRGHKTRRPRSAGTDRRDLIVGSTSIDERPIEVSERLVPGHWRATSSKAQKHRAGSTGQRQRKSLGWNSPAEFFLPEGLLDFQAYWVIIIKPVEIGA